MTIKTIAEDDREIALIHKAGDYQTDDYRVGSRGVTKIAPYEESGEYSMLTFMAVFQGNHLIARVPAANLHVVYKRNDIEDGAS